MTALCFIDTETTGVHPGRLAWEIALIRRDDTGERERTIQVTDVDLSNADPFGLNIGGFYERHVDYDGKREDDVLYMTEADAATFIEDWTRGAHLVGAVPDFDARTLDPMLRRHGLIPAWHYHLVDVEAMAVGWLNARHAASRHGATDPRLPIAPPWKSDTLSMMCGVNPPSEAERHTALGDARWAMRWYDAMTGGER